MKTWKRVPPRAFPGGIGEFTFVTILLVNRIAFPYGFSHWLFLYRSYLFLLPFSFTPFFFLNSFHCLQFYLLFMLCNPFLFYSLYLFFHLFSALFFRLQRWFFCVLFNFFFLFPFFFIINLVIHYLMLLIHISLTIWSWFLASPLLHDATILVLLSNFFTFFVYLHFFLLFIFLHTPCRRATSCKRTWSP